MFTPTKPELKNLKIVNFENKSTVLNCINELITSGIDPYTASLPLIAAAALGDEKTYDISKKQIIEKLETLESNPTSYSEWMRNNSFKAWMWGRIVLAADTMNDLKTSLDATQKLERILKENPTNQDSLAFFTWARGYLAALNQKKYITQQNEMFNGAMKLTARFRDGNGDHESLSNALWAWVMCLSAAANAEDDMKYNWIKAQILFLTGENSIKYAIEKGLLRTAASNDYPAWAFAKIRNAASIMKDSALYFEIENALTYSISESKKVNAKAEYVLSTVEAELALSHEIKLQSKPSKVFHAVK